MMIGMMTMKTINTLIYFKNEKDLYFFRTEFVMLSSTYAQKGRQAIGFGLSYGTEIESAGFGN